MKEDPRVDKRDPPLVAHWQFDKSVQRDSNEFPDLSGNNNIAIVTPGAKFESGPQWGRALSLDGHTHAVVTPSLSLDVGANGGNLSVSLFILLRQRPNGQWRVIVSKGRTDQERTFAMWLRYDSNRIHARISTDRYWNEGIEASLSEISLATWTHVAYVKKDNELFLYVDGSLDSRVVLRGRSVSNPGPVYLGKDPRYEGFHGALDDVRVYSSALSADEVAVLAGNTFSNKPS